MKKLKDFILEGNTNKAMFDACMALENDENVYLQLNALAKQVEKKIQKDDFNFDKLVNSSSIDKLITACIKITKENVDSESRKTLRKYFVGCVLKLVDNNINLPKELEDLYKEWDFYKKLDW